MRKKGCGLRAVPLYCANEYRLENFLQSKPVYVNLKRGKSGFEVVRL